jgi:micrococcal nuclease
MVAGINRSLQKAPQRGAFLLFVASCWLSIPGVVSGACQSYRAGNKLAVSHVYDGDTLKLADGRSIRLIGIDTPEIGRDGKRDEPGAAVALHNLKQIVRASDNLIFMLPGVDDTDRYGRKLAHLYDQQGRNITEMLLRAGLGFTITFPPNLQNMECYRAAELQARNARRGLWRAASIPLDAGKLSGNEEGFHLLRGRIERIGKSRRALWLNLVQGPALRIDWSDWKNFSNLEPTDLPGRRLEVRGWLYRRKGQQRMQVRHPSAVKWLE